jgi:hypothetical protein
MRAVKKGLSVSRRARRGRSGSKLVFDCRDLEQRQVRIDRRNCRAEFGDRLRGIARRAKENRIRIGVLVFLALAGTRRVLLAAGTVARTGTNGSIWASGI